MRDVVNCPSCKVEISIQTNRAIKLRKDLRKALRAHFENTPYFKKMDSKYKKLRINQMLKTEFQRIIKDETREIKA